MGSYELHLSVFQSLKARLMLAFGGASMAALVALGGYLSEVATHELSEFGGESLHTAARAAADQLAIHIRERSLEIDLLRRSPLFVEGDLRGQAMRDTLDLRKSVREEYIWLGVAAADGTVLQATDGVLLGQNVGQRPWFENAKVGPYAGDVHEAVLLAKLLAHADPASFPRLIDFASPILDASGKLRGVLGAHASWDWVTGIVSSTVRGPLDKRDVEVLIANSKGDVLYPHALFGKLQVPDMAGYKTRFKVVAWEGGQEYLTAVADVRNVTQTPLDWHVVLRQPLSEALEPVNDLRWQLAGVGALVLLLFGLLAYRIAHRVSLPIALLAQAADTVYRREGVPAFPAPRDAGSAEVALLCHSFQTMTESLLQGERALRDLNASLEAQVLQRTAELSEANVALARLSSTDALTGLNNRRSFDAQLQQAFVQARQGGPSFAVLVIDADRFKSINDTHGHFVGDEVLQHLAVILRENVRTTDFTARYGGEEFVVLLPDVDGPVVASRVAEKVRQAIEDSVFPAVGRVTVSIGMAAYQPGDDRPMAMVQRADEALYDAKNAGRNAVRYR